MGFDKEVLGRLPLANAVLTLWLWITEEAFVQSLFDKHRGACYEKQISFPVMVHLIADAILQHQGSGRKSFERAKETEQLTTSLAAAYQKLSRLPLSLSEAFLGESTQRLLEVFPKVSGMTLPSALQRFQMLALDGKVVKRVPRRLKVLLEHKGGVLGGKALAALDLNAGLVIGLASAEDGEVNDARLVPALLKNIRPHLTREPLYVADRQFCDLNQTEAFTEGNGHFLVRYHPKVKYCQDAKPKARHGRDSQGRAWTEDWGWLGSPSNKRRRYVRRITLERPGEQAIVLITDLLDADEFPANDLLELYLKRWGIERVFQQITEVFHLSTLIGTTPKGTVFQLAFCLLMYNLIHVVRAYVAAAQKRETATISLEMLFDDVRRQLVAVTELLPPERILALMQTCLTAAQVRARLTELLKRVWHGRWLKAPPKKRQPPPKDKESYRDHTSVARILAACRQQKTKEAASG